MDKLVWYVGKLKSDSCSEISLISDSFERTAIWINLHYEQSLSQSGKRNGLWLQYVQAHGHWEMA